MRNTAMNKSQYFIAKDYLRAFDLKNIFHKYVVIYAQLHCREGDDPLSNKDRNELNLKLQEAMNEMTLLVLKMKESKQQKAELANDMLPAVHTTKTSTNIAQQIN
jgi:hypothetical protein